jgi:hypothetical protein
MPAPEPVALDAAVAGAVAAQRDADAGAQADPYVGNAIAAAAPETKQRRASWKDWLPEGAPEPGEDDLRSRDDLVAAVNARLRTVHDPSWAIGADDLRYWEYKRILPQAVRRKHDGQVRAVYPWWMAPVVFALREWQHDKHGLPWIGETVQSVVTAALRQDPTGKTVADALVREFAREAFFGNMANYHRRAELLLGRTIGTVAAEHAHDGFLTVKHDGESHF